MGAEWGAGKQFAIIAKEGGWRRRNLSWPTTNSLSGRSANEMGGDVHRSVRQHFRNTSIQKAAKMNNIYVYVRINT